MFPRLFRGFLSLPPSVLISAYCLLFLYLAVSIYILFSDE
ncbi:hypothetical protein 2011_scaffold3_00048 [Bacteriophage sp.]|nr:hypothetical protein 2011_scaffold3_00048 [Bacteriophage sp.]